MIVLGLALVPKEKQCSTADGKYSRISGSTMTCGLEQWKIFIGFMTLQLALETG